MAVLPSDIGVELDRTVTSGSALWNQWASWIQQAERAISRRAERMGVDPATLDPETVDDVITWAVVRRATRPVDGAQSTSDQLGVDDGAWNHTRNYGQAQGDIHFLDAWWDELGLLRRRRAFTTRLGGRAGYRP